MKSETTLDILILFLGVIVIYEWSRFTLFTLHEELLIYFNLNVEKGS